MGANYPHSKERTRGRLPLRLNLYKCMGPDDVHSKVVGELADVAAEPLSIIFEKLWLSGRVPRNWKGENVSPIYKKGRKEKLRSYRLLSLSSVPWKISRGSGPPGSRIKAHEERVVDPRQQNGFTKGKSCRTNLTAF